MHDRTAIGQLDQADLEQLLGLDPKVLLGRIVLLNRQPRYHNCLDAIKLVVGIGELRARRSNRAGRSSDAGTAASGNS
ncbi:MAG: hypothetical protein JST38_19295 [Bacteroidetes bacterium]|nr:hypothetical protein [Bacteroidota bacterium]MBS1943013.1 hypothetical protein [Bacteroidota bacterium]